MLVHSNASCAPVETDSALSLPEQEPTPPPAQPFTLPKRRNQKTQSKFLLPPKISDLGADDLTGPGLVLSAWIQVGDHHIHSLELLVLGGDRTHLVCDLIPFHRHVLALDAVGETKNDFTFSFLHLASNWISFSTASWSTLVSQVCVDVL